MYAPNHKRYNNKFFCSRKCSDGWQRLRRPERTCENCGVKFRKKAKPNAKYCSLECHLSSEENIAKLARMRKKQGSLRITRLEQAGYEIIGLEYERQFVYGRYVADAFISELDLIIQFDGDYWHGNPRTFP